MIITRDRLKTLSSILISLERGIRAFFDVFTAASVMILWILVLEGELAAVQGVESPETRLFLQIIAVLILTWPALAVFAYLTNELAEVFPERTEPAATEATNDDT